MNISNKLIAAYINDTELLIKEMDELLKRRNSYGCLDEQSVNELFRIFHTVKASANAIEDSRTAEVSCDIENVIAYLRKYGPSSLPSEDVMNLLFKSEYYFRTRINSYRHRLRENDDADEFEGLLKNFMSSRHIDAAERENEAVPFSDIFPMCRNIVETMSQELSKEAVLKTAGAEILINGRYILRLSAAIVHLIRNAMDHGIESPQERTKAGKPSCGVVTITYGLEQELFFVTVFNDGKKLNLKEILRKAARLHMLKKPRSEYRVEEIANLILQNGFTTKDKIGKYSGRGVGMDVIKSTAKDLGGTVFINSGESYGFSATIAFPAEDKAWLAP